QRGGDFAQRQAVRGPQPLSVLHRRQRDATSVSTASNNWNMEHLLAEKRIDGRMFRKHRVSHAFDGDESGPGQGRAGNRRVTPGLYGQIRAVARSE
ncbi:hypothetical protein, partial [Streptomyces milbemycinicus]